MASSVWRKNFALLICTAMLCSVSGESDIRKILNGLLSNSTGLMAALNVSKPCLKVVTSPFFFQKAGKYVDAIGKPASGLALGNLYWPGSYQLCTSVPDSNYCLGDVIASYGAGAKFPATVGLCVPSQCNPSDTEVLFNYAVSALKLSNYFYIPKHGNVLGMAGKSVYCPPAKTTYGAGAIGALTLCGLLLLLCLLGTCTEIMQEFISSHRKNVNKSATFMPVKTDDTEEGILSDNGYYSRSGDDITPLIPINTSKKSLGAKVLDLLLCFSLIKNTRAIVNTDTPANGIGCINGIRVFSMWWVILGHVEAFSAQPLVTDNILSAIGVLRRFTFLPVANGVFSVDSFFLLSGLLVAYVSMRRLETKGRLPLLGFYVHRYLRLTPVYMFVILFTMYIVPLIGNGPIWSLAAQGVQFDSCRKYWWTNILYINNFYPTAMQNSCIGWTWYLANDMQFYVISPIFLYIMYRFKMVGTLLSVSVALTASFVATGVLIGHYHLNPFTADDIGGGATQKQVQFMKYIYVKPYCRIAPYLVGMVAGYMLHAKHKLGGTFKWVIALLGWAIAISLGLMVTYGTWPNYKNGKPVFNDAINVAYGTFSRFVWGVALAWLIYACFFKFGGLINNFLSWKAFVPLSRLTYGVYMVHILVLEVFYYGRDKPLHFTDIEMAIVFMATTVTSYAASFVLAVCVEVPFTNMEKLVFKF